MTFESVSPRQGMLLVAAGAALWGTGGIAAKALFGVAGISPLAVGFFRLALSVPALLVLGWALYGPRILRAAGPRLWVLGVLSASMALYQVFFYAAVARAGVTIAALVTLCTAPVMVAILSALLLAERPTGTVLAALALALAGTVLLVGFPSDVGAGREAVLAGAALALGSGLMYAVVTLTGRSLAGHYHPYQLIVLGFGGGALMLLPFVLWQGFAMTHSVPGWLLLLYLGLVPTALAYVLFFNGMRATPATVASILSLMEPLTAATLAWLIFDERLGPLGLAGAVLLLGALVILYRSGRRKTVVPAGRARLPPA